LYAPAAGHRDRHTTPTPFTPAKNPARSNKSPTTQAIGLNRIFAISDTAN
jgi:hypothetical protein